MNSAWPAKNTRYPATYTAIYQPWRDWITCLWKVQAGKSFRLTILGVGGGLGSWCSLAFWRSTINHSPGPGHLVTPRDRWLTSSWCIFHAPVTHLDRHYRHLLRIAHSSRDPRLSNWEGKSGVRGGLGLLVLASSPPFWGCPSCWVYNDTAISGLTMSPHSRYFSILWLLALSWLTTWDTFTLKESSNTSLVRIFQGILDLRTANFNS